MAQSLPDVLFRQRDDSYLRDLEVEAEYWNREDDTLLSREAMPAVQSYVNRRLSGDPEKKWYEVIGDGREFREGCVLGAGPGDLERHLLQRHEGLRLTVYDIAVETLERLRSAVGSTLAERLETRQSDLNFAELPAATYDLVVAQSAIHHIVNLEHVAYQVNASLTDDGRFYMYDVVSESYFQFAEVKKRLHELLINATGDEHRLPLRVNWPDRANWTFSPFESVRSGDILEVFGSYLVEESRRTSSSLVGLTIFGVQQATESGITRFVRRALQPLLLRAGRRGVITRGLTRGQLMFELDSLTCDTGYLEPGLAFVVYGKRGPDVQGNPSS